MATFKAADTSDIPIQALIPAAARYNDRTRNQKHSAALCPEIGFQYQKLKRIGTRAGYCLNNYDSSTNTSTLNAALIPIASIR